MRIVRRREPRSRLDSKLLKMSKGGTEARPELCEEATFKFCLHPSLRGRHWRADKAEVVWRNISNANVYHTSSSATGGRRSDLVNGEDIRQRTGHTGHTRNVTTSDHVRQTFVATTLKAAKNSSALCHIHKEARRQLSTGTDSEFP